MQSTFLDERMPTDTREYNGAGVEEERQELDADDGNNGNGRCGCCTFQGHRESQGINIAGLSRGAISMSNVYLANSMIHLACKQAGGFEIEGREQCTNYSLEVYGMKPATLISNIAVIASVLTALLMPVFGAIIDFTPHRRMVGVGTSIFLVVISGIQIGTTENTWFAMAVLQAIIFMIYQIQMLAIFAYFPEINSEVGPKKMNEYTSTWSLNQFITQALFNAFIIGMATSLKLNTVVTSMLSQGGTFLICAVFLSWGWWLIPNRPARHKLPKGQSLVFAGFSQNWKTCKNIWKNYKTGLRWFLVSTVFGEAAASAISSTAVIFLNGNLGLSPVQIGIFFEVTLVTVILGTKIGALVTRYTNPNTSLKLSQLGICLTLGIGVHLVQVAKVQNRVYIWGAVVGIFLGWFFPTENLFFSQCIPRKQEAELAGFFIYCSQILGWFPPLIFSIMVQNNINMKWALTAVASIFLISIFFLCLCGSWPEILEEARTTNVEFFQEDGNQDVDEECDEEKSKPADNIVASNMKEDNNNSYDNGQ